MISVLLKKNILDLLKDDKNFDDYLISVFVDFNNILSTSNDLILSSLYKIKKKAKYKHLLKLFKNETIEFTIEDLIKLFEISIPKEEQIKNGEIYTPAYIRKFIVKQSLGKFSNLKYENVKIADISCGSGSFLYEIAKYLKYKTSKSFNEIYRDNIFGVDISSKSIKRSKIILSLLALSNHEDSLEFNFNLYVGNSLEFDWAKNIGISCPNGKFDAIVGNPPYVRTKHIDEKTKNLMRKWEITKSGNPDLYIPFFEIGINNLDNFGVLGYITSNTFKRSVNARNLRKYLQSKKYSIEILDFGDSQVFEKKSTYTCIVFIKKEKSSTINYIKISPDKLDSKEKYKFNKISYNELDYKRGWMLNNENTLINIHKIESIGSSLGKKYTIKNGLATLRNDIFIFKPEGESKNFYYMKYNNLEYSIEKNICKDIIKPNILKSENDIPNLTEKIIFPYKSVLDHSNENSRFELFEESWFRINYPKAYIYLDNYKQLLLKRDKGKNNHKYKWYEFGRTQAMTYKGKKLFFPYMANKPYFVYTEQENLLYYAGYAIFSKNEQELLILKKILESKLFWYYIQNTSKPYANKYFALAKNYVKDFGLCELSNREKKYILKTDDEEEINEFLFKKYNISL